MLVLYFWFKEISGNNWASVVGSVALGLSQIRWEYQVHLHTWGMQYWLLGTWLVIKWVKGEKWVKGVAGAVLLGAQMWESVLPTYFGLAVVGCWLAVNGKFEFKKIALAGVIAALIAWPVIKVYSGVAREMGFVRTIRDAANGGMSVDDVWGKFYSTGLYLLLMVAIVTEITHPNPSLYKREGNFRWLLMVVVVGVVMALGPVLKWQGKTVKVAGYAIPLPYAIAYYAVPGLQASRTVSRWMWLAGFGMSGLIAVALSKPQIPNPKKQTNFNYQFTRSKISRMMGIMGCFGIAIVGGTHLVKYRELPRPENFPSIYRWLKDQPGKVILELPKGGEDVELQRMYYSWLHGKKMVNGYSGFAPPPVDVKADYVIIHKNDEESAVVDNR